MAASDYDAWTEDERKAFDAADIAQLLLIQAWNGGDRHVNPRFVVPTGPDHVTGIHYDQLD
jgi:hypothetical protein